MYCMSSLLAVNTFHVQCAWVDDAQLRFTKSCCPTNATAVSNAGTLPNQVATPPMPAGAGHLMMVLRAHCANQIQPQHTHLQGVPETTKAPGTVSSGSADRLIARRLGDLETRVGNGEADSNRKSEAQRELLADVQSEVADAKNRLGNTRDASRGHARRGAWRESVAGLRKNIDEVSTTSIKARDDTRRIAENQERSATEVEPLRDEMKEARESIAKNAAVIAEQKRENERLNFRVEALVGLVKENQQRVATLENLLKETQRDFSNLGPKVAERTSPR